MLDLPVKNKEEAYEKIIETSRNNDYTNGNFLDFAYFKENYRLIAIDLSKETKLKDLQQINFIGRLKSRHQQQVKAARTMEQQYFSSLKNQKKLLLNFYKILWFYKMGTQKIVNLLNSSENKFSKFRTQKMVHY